MARENVKLTRAEKREIRRTLQNEIKEFIKIQAHYFPDLIQDIKNVMDKRHQSYITYEIEVILYMMILKNACSLESMQEMSDEFNNLSNKKILPKTHPKPPTAESRNIISKPPLHYKL